MALPDVEQPQVQGHQEEAVGGGGFGSSIGLFGDVLKHTAGGVKHADRIGCGPEDASEGDGMSSASQEHGLGWQTVAFIQIGEIVGAGVLTLGMAFAQLGFALALALLVILGLANVYIGILLSRSHRIYPDALSYAEFASVVDLRKWMVEVTRWGTLVYIVFSMSSYFLALSQTLAMAFWWVDMCVPLWSLVSMALIIVPVQIRDFTGAKWLFWINFFWIMSALVMILVYLCTHMGSIPDAETYIGVPPGTTWTDIFGGLSKITFAYLGCYIYFEMMAEMKKPDEFPRTFALSAPVQVGTYSVVGAISYAYAGTTAQDSILKEINPHTDGALLTVTALFLALHLVVSYFIIGVAFHRSLHQFIHPQTLEDNSWRGRGVWFTITICTLVFAYLVSNGITFFDSLVSILGSLFGPFLAFLAPVGFFVLAMRAKGDSIGLAEKILLAVIVVYAFVLLFAGTAANLITLADNFSTSGTSPFECVAGSYEDNFGTGQM